MWEDPIVKDVRKAGEEFAKQSKYDMDQFFQKLRKNEKKRKSKVVFENGIEGFYRKGIII